MHMRHDEIRQKYGKINIPCVCFKLEWTFMDEKMYLFKFSFYAQWGISFKKKKRTQRGLSDSLSQSQEKYRIGWTVPSTGK